MARKSRENYSRKGIWTSRLGAPIELRLINHIIVHFRKDWFVAGHIRSLFGPWGIQVKSRKSESSYFSDASNSDFDENLIIPDASCSESESEIIIESSEPIKCADSVKQPEPVVLEEPEVIKVIEAEEIEVEDIEDDVDDRTTETSKAEDDSLSHAARLEAWETKLKEEKKSSLQRRNERKSLDLLGSLDDKKKNLFETKEVEIDRPATVATVSLGKKFLS